LTAGGTCTIVVAFEPTGLGLASDTVQINYNDGAANQNTTRAMQGTGAAPASLAINSGPTYDYTSITVGNFADHTFTITNSGGVAATAMAETGLAAPFAYVGGTYPGTGGTCSTSLSAGSTCDIVVRFAPTATGVVTDQLVLGYYNGAATTSTTRDIQGTGLGAAVLAISDGPGNYDFGTHPTGGTTQKVFTMNNTGGSTATAIAGGGLASPFQFAGGVFPGGGTCGATLAAGANCTFIVEYVPVAVSASDTDTIQINYNDGAGAQVSNRGVQGVAVAPAFLTLSDTDPYNFGTLATGSSASHTFTLTNTGTFQASSINEIGLAAPFTFVGGSFPGTGGTCTNTMAGTYTSCTLVIL
jgi:hypothetical protein